MKQPSPISVSSWTTTLAPKTTPAPTLTLAPSNRLGASPEGCRATALPDRKVGGADRLAAVAQRAFHGLEHAHDVEPVAPVGQRPAAVAHALDEVLDLEPERLVVGQVRN